MISGFPKAALLSFAVLLLLTAGCDSSRLYSPTVTISEIVAAPDQFKGKKVRIVGTCINASPAVDFIHGHLSDGEKSIIVIPYMTFAKLGEKVSMRGHIDTDYKPKAQSTLAFIESKEGITFGDMILDLAVHKKELKKTR